MIIANMSYVGKIGLLLQLNKIELERFKISLNLAMAHIDDMNLGVISKEEKIIKEILKTIEEFGL